VQSATKVDYVDDAYGEYYPMAGGFEVEAGDDDNLEDGKKGAAAAAAASSDQGNASADKAKADAMANRQNTSKLSSQLQKIQNIMQRKGQDHTEAFLKPPKVCVFLGVWVCGCAGVSVGVIVCHGAG
jgi:hypothetical protein